MSYTLEIRYADRPPETRTFEQPVAVIGRDHGDIAMNDAQVSGRHAELRFDGRSLIFRDLGSSNGSFDPAGQRLQPQAAVALAIDQPIRLGGSCMIILKSIAPAAGGTMMMPAMPRAGQPGGPPGARPPAGPQPGAAPAQYGGPPHQPHYGAPPPPSAQPQHSHQPPAQPQFGQPPPAAQPQHSHQPPAQPQFGQPPPAAQHGQPPPAAQPQFGQPPPAGQHGQPPAAQPHGQAPPAAQPQYGQPPPAAQPQHSHQPPAPAQPQYGQPPPAAQPQYGQSPPAAQPQYGQPPPAAQPQYGQPPPAAQPQYGQPPPAAHGQPPPAAQPQSHEHPSPDSQPSFSHAQPSGIGQEIEHVGQQLADFDGTSFKGIVQRAWAFAQPNLVQLVLTFAAVFVGVGAINFFLGWIPVVGMILSGVSGLIMLVAGPLSVAALGYFVLKARVGQPVSAVDAWKTVMRSLVPVWLNFVVAGFLMTIGFAILFVPGVLLGFFIIPMFFVENKRMVAINLGSMEWVKRDLVKIVILMILCSLVIIPIGVFSALGSWVVGLVSDYMAATIYAFLMSIAVAIIVTMMVIMSVQMYFDMAAATGRDIEAEVRAALERFEAGVTDVGSMTPPAVDLGTQAPPQPMPQSMPDPAQGYQQPGYPPQAQPGYPPQPQPGYPPQPQPPQPGGYPPPGGYQG